MCQQNSQMNTYHNQPIIQPVPGTALGLSISVGQIEIRVLRMADESLKTQFMCGFTRTWTSNLNVHRLSA